MMFYICVNVYIHMCIHVCVCAYTHAHVCICIYVCTYMHMHALTKGNKGFRTWEEGTAAGPLSKLYRSNVRWSSDDSQTKKIFSCLLSPVNLPSSTAFSRPEDDDL